MTAHKSKGLEYEFVYIVGATDGHWGNKREIRNFKIPMSGESVQAGSQIDDERRLFYVAMTRAKKEAAITYSLEGENGEKLRLPGYNSVAGFGDPTYFMLSKLHPFFDRILIPGGDWEALEYSIPSSYVKSCLKILEIFNSHVSKVELVLKVTADLGLDPSKIYLGDLVEQLDLLNNWGLLNNDSE